MRDGERVRVQGSSGTYVLSRDGDVYMCTCPAWRNQKAAPAQRSCKHLRARLGEAQEAARVGGGKMAAAQRQARTTAAGLPREPVEARARRDAAVEAAVARFPAVAARMQAVYGMQLPRHLAYAAAFWLGLSDEERGEAWAYLGNGLAGVGEWFEPDGMSRPALNDERLQFRFRCDPPEFVTVCTYSSDGGHWGLWYDEPRELPRAIAFNYARDDAVTSLRGPTLLTALRELMTREKFPASEWPYAARVRAWLEEMHALELAAHQAEAIAPPPARSSWCIAGVDPALPGARLPDDLVGGQAQEARMQAYRDDPGRVRGWIAQARRELSEGAPLRALFLGRELHWADGDPLREETTALLVDAYVAAGRSQLAEVVRVHHANRDLRSVDVYGEAAPPEDPPLVEAATAGDAALALALLDEATPEPATFVAALERAQEPALSALLGRAPPDVLSATLEPLVRGLAHLYRLTKAPPDGLDRVERLLAHGAPAATALARALEAEFWPLALQLAARVDPRQADAQGVTPLHRAAQAGATEVAALLLERGADVEARDARGETPVDRARAIWQDRREASHALLALLRGRLPVAAPAPTGALAAGDWVTHAKFGEGRVAACEGEGEAAKLTITFADATRTLLARFVRRA